MTALLQNISPACYKQLYNDALLTIPSPLRRLCLAIDINTMITASTIAYITASMRKIPEHERLVSVLMDEV